MEFLAALLHTNQNDIYTSLFELVFLWTGIVNLKTIIRDKQVTGFDWRMMILYVAWNIWSIIAIYPPAALWYASALTALYILTQLVWIWLAWKSS